MKKRKINKIGDCKYGQSHLNAWLDSTNQMPFHKKIN